MNARASRAPTRFLLPVACLALGLAAGWFAGRRPVTGDGAPGAPPQWVAKVGGEYITPQMLRNEMERRGGHVPGQYQTLEQKRALLDEMLLHAALVDAARNRGLDRQPDTRRSIEQLLTTQYLQATLRAEQQQVAIDEKAVRAYYEEHAEDFAVPARRRVAMIRIGVPEGADEAAWKRATGQANEALAKARRLGSDVPHFGAVAREYSDDPSSRYRGGVIGWLTDGRAADYRFDRRLLDAAFALEQAGQFSPVIRGEDGVYVARLIERQERQARPFEQLRAGIEQRLAQQRYQEIERSFRDALLDSIPVDVDERALAAVEPPGPPGGDDIPQPPAMPVAQETTP